MRKQYEFREPAPLPEAKWEDYDDSPSGLLRLAKYMQAVVQKRSNAELPPPRAALEAWLKGRNPDETIEHVKRLLEEDRKQKPLSYWWFCSGINEAWRLAK